MLPLQQRATERAEFNPFIYDLTRNARDHLSDLGLSEPTHCPTGHWWHSYLTACVTSSLDICATRAGVRYIPAHEILALNDASFAIPLGTATLIPDQLFALDYGGCFRAFAVEIDRGTEPKTSSANRKSWARSIAQYDDVLSRETYKSHYGLKANLLVLWVFTNRVKEMRFLELMRRQRGAADQSILTQSLPKGEMLLGARNLLTNLFQTPWNRVSGVPVCIAGG